MKSLLFGGIFLLSLCLLAAQVALGMDVPIWHLLITGAMGGLWARNRAESRAR